MTELPADLLSNNVATAMAAEAVGRLRAASLIRHPGERGRARENVIRDFVANLVPPAFGLSSGFVVDSVGGESRQQDVVIYRRDYHPTFSIGEVRYFPIESVAAVIEVKSSLNSAALSDAISNGISVKALDRTGGGANYLVTGGVNGGAVNPELHDHQVFTAIVAADAIGLDTLVDVFRRDLADVARRQWTNMVAVAEQWSIQWDPHDGRPRSDQMTAKGIRIAPAGANGNPDPLLDLAEQLWSFLRVAPLVDVAPSRYVVGGWWGERTFALPGAE